MNLKKLIVQVLNEAPAAAPVETPTKPKTRPAEPSPVPGPKLPIPPVPAPNVSPEPKAKKMGANNVKDKIKEQIRLFLKKRNLNEK